MGARLVAAGDEQGLAVPDFLQGRGNALLPFDLGRIAGGSHEDKVVVHEVNPLGAEPIGDEFLLQGLGMHHDHVKVAAFRQFQCRSRAGAHMADNDARLLLELRFEDIDNTRINGADGAGQQNLLVPCVGLRRCRLLGTTGADSQ